MFFQIFVWGQGNIGAMTFHPEETNIAVQLVDTKGISIKLDKQNYTDLILILLVQIWFNFVFN